MNLLKRAGQLSHVIWGQLAVAAVALVGIRIYTEILGTSDFGSAMLAQGLIALVDSVGILALSQTLISKCGPVTDREGRREMSVGLSWHFVKWCVVVGMSITLIGSCVAVGFGADEWWLLVPAVFPVYVAAETAKHSVLSLVILDRRYSFYSGWMSAEAVITLLTTCASLTLWRTDALGFVVGYALARPLSAGLFVALTAPGHFRGLTSANVRGELESALAYGRPVALMGPLGWVSTYVDRYILGAALSTSAVGRYAAVTGLVSRPYSLTTAVLTNYYRPLYFQAEVLSRGHEAQLPIFRRWLMSAIGLGIAGACAFALLGDLIAKVVLAPDFREEAALLMCLFAVAQTFTIATHSADNLLLAMQKSSELLKLQVVLSVTTLLAIPVGIGLGGLVGAVVGRCVAEAIKFCAVLLLVRHVVATAAATQVTTPVTQAGSDPA